MEFEEDRKHMHVLHVRGGERTYQEYEKCKKNRKKQWTPQQFKLLHSPLAENKWFCVSCSHIVY